MNDVMLSIEKFKDLLATEMFEDEEERKRFDIASSHPYECRCELCAEWWLTMGPEPED